ncbi:MAG TPA: LCP family protein [Candidatus Saccharimonadia bacterium]|nr:LCP family protein [Candidatus Saccharimonadia bacterium]
MTPTNPGGRRALDGPMRRVAPLPSKPRTLTTPEPEPRLVSPSVPQSSPEAEAPVFEYRKPKKWRVHVLKWTRRAALVVVLLIVASGLWLGYKAVDAARHIIVHSGGGLSALADVLKPTQLKGASSGRVNILVLGIGGEGHDGANLTDTMMVWSLDIKTKAVAMISVPRDLYVKIPGYGYGKINAANAYGGPKLSEQAVENVIGVPIDYYAIIDFSGFKQAVNAVGGVDIDVPTPLVDPFFPCDDGTKYAGKYCPIYFKAGLQHMDGEHALEYSRSRETTSDFARAARQQQVILALRQKALQLSTLTNPLKLSGLIDAVGGHLTTDLQLGDMEQLASFAKGIDPTKVDQKVIDETGPDSLLVDATNKIPGAGSIELPRAGEFDYSDIQSFVRNIFVSGQLTSENALIQIQNGSGVTGLAAGVTASLLGDNLNVTSPSNASGLYPDTVIYDYTDGKKPYTINYLESRFGVKASVESAPATTAVDGTATVAPDIRIILGSNYPASQNSQ